MFRDWHVPAGNQTLASTVRGEHSSKELFEQLVDSYLKYKYIWASDSYINLLDEVNIYSEVGKILTLFSAIDSKETIQSQHYKIEKKSSALKMDFDGIQEGKIINQIKTTLL